MMTNKVSQSRKALEIERLTNVSAVSIVFPDRENKNEDSDKPDFE